MWPSESDLEPIDSIIDRMNPILGFPYPMKSARNEGFPKSVGNPWVGAYTKNGYWFKLSFCGENEWTEMSNEMWYRNEMLVDEKSFHQLEMYFNTEKEAENKNNLKLLCAKNIRGEVIGLALLSKYSTSQLSVIGPIFVQEDFRHVGIGSILMKEIMKIERNVVFNSISYLLPRTSSNFGLEPKLMRNFGRIRVKKPSGFASLKEEKPGICVKLGVEITDEPEWDKISEFGEKCTSEKKNWKIFEELEKQKDGRTQLAAAFDEATKECVGISILREIHNEDGHIPDLLVAPLYSKNSKITEVLLRKTLLKHYNPEDDYDFDVDHEAIYRRSVNFYVFSATESIVFPLLKKLTGSEGKMKKDRLTFQTCANFQLPAISHDFIFALSNPNFNLS